MYTLEYYSAIKNPAICSKMDGTKGYHVKGYMPATERQELHVLSQMWKLKKANLKLKIVITREGGGGGKRAVRFDQGTVYASIKLSY
jgi:hypothetical protein